MLPKFSSLAKLLLIWGVILAAFIISSLHQDITQNKLLNYEETYSSPEVEVKSSYESQTTLKYIFKLTSHDNYLGSVSFKYFRLKGNPGQVVFRIQETDQNTWYAQNRYDFSFFNSDDTYFFGFPEIAKSQGKHFTIEFEIISSQLYQKSEFLDLKTVPILKLKYVFPHDTFYKSPNILFRILTNRLVSTLSKIDYFRVVLTSLAIALFCLLIFFRSSDHARPKNHRILSREKVQVVVYQTNKINPFILPLGILFILSVALGAGSFLLAERLAVYLWVSLLISTLYYILQVAVINKLAQLSLILNNISTRVLSALDDTQTLKTFIVLGFLYVIISGLSPVYYLGGDDSRLFYLYPREFFVNYSSKIVSDTGVSQLTNWIPSSSLAAFTLLMLGLKSALPFLNLQAVLNSTNIIGGVLTFYFLISFLLSPKNRYERVICILASIMYVFSIFNFYTLFNSRLVAQYLISLFPLSLHLVIKSIRESKIYLLIITSVIWSAFNLVSVAFTVSGAALLTSLPLLVFTSWRFKARSAVYFICLVLITLVLNIHWLFFVPFSNFAKNQPGSSGKNITSTEFRRQNEAGIRTVSEINNSFFPLLNSYHQKIQLIFNWPQLPIYSSWYTKLLITGFFFTSVIIFAGITIDRDKARSQVYIILTACFLLAVYFFTVNVTPWGVDLFVWLTDHIPGFVIFRNMYDKFAYSMALHWATLVAVSCCVVVKSLRTENQKAKLLFLFLVIVILNSKPFILGEFQKLPYWTTHNSYDGIQKFNTDYKDLLSFVKQQPSAGRYLSLPLLTGNSSIIQDEYQPNHYYAGVSPLLLLTGKNDLSGLISFSDKSQDVYHWIQDKDYQRFGRLLQQLNVSHVIVNQSISSDLQNSFMFSDGLYNLQTDKFIASTLGPKVADFGLRYSLYKIAPQYASEKIYVTDNPYSFSDQYSKSKYIKIASHEYLVDISDLDHPQTLVFLDPYLSGWQLQSSSGKNVFSNHHFLELGYANAWALDPPVITASLTPPDYTLDPDGKIGLHLRLYFQPYDYYYPLLILSLVGYGLCSVFIAYSLVSKRHK